MTEHLTLSTAPAPLKLRVDDYLILDRAGAFTSYVKTELLEGVIVGVNAQFSRHARAQRAIFLLLNSACVRLGLEALFEFSIRLDDRNMPQPDIVVARHIPDEGPLAPQDVVLVVEIADASLMPDLTAKARIYAAGGIPEYWVLDANARLVHQMWSPGPEGYAEQDNASLGERIKSVMSERLEIDTRGLV